ncbi:MAG TPA: hypothetical protein VFE78_22835 [Gemmataceae bacterium]|nr:hypothetical protein [Gemmataceae bacterium]
MTLDLTLRLLRCALPRPKLTEDEAIRLMEYHLRRNRTAKASHRKSWLKRHNKVEFKVLL